MIIDRKGDLLVISDPPSVSRYQWFCALIILAVILLMQTGSYAGSTASFVFAALLAVFALVPMPRRTEIDQRLRQVRIYKGWLWGFGKGSVVQFDDIASVDVDVSSSETGDLHIPQLLLKSRRYKWLSVSCDSPADAENVARAVRHAIFGTS